ncbi:MAG: hypothetical protein ACRCWJ_12580 [Casimicrobium sp.]
MKNRLIPLLFSLCCFIATSVSAQQAQWCQWHVDSVWVNSYGMLLGKMRERGDHIGFCNLNANHGDITPITCATWFQLLRTATVKNVALTVHYLDAPACAQIPTYGNSPKPYYIMLNQPIS